MFSGLAVVQPSTRRWTTLASFALQIALVAAALLFPMFYPQNLPQVFLSRRIFVPLSNGEVRADAGHGGGGSGGPPLQTVLIVSSGGGISKARASGLATGPEAPSLGQEGTGLQDLALVGSGPAPLPAPPKTSRPPRTSVVMEGNLIRRVEPQYPPIAKQVHLEGSVVLKAIISREGNIERLEVVSGPGLLARAARDAVLQWKYRPYLLNQEPVEVETQITVNFVLEH